MLTYWGTRRIVVVDEVDVDDSALCFLLDDGEIIRAAINRNHSGYAMAHADLHARRGIKGFQLCALSCDDV